MKAALRRIRISPKKANLIAGMVRNKKVNEALDLLKFLPKKGAKIIYKVVNSAAANAKNNFKQSVDDLVITKILVTKGPTYKRSLPISRGRVHPINKRTSHIMVEVGVADKKVAQSADKKVSSSKKEKIKKDTPQSKITKKESKKSEDKKADKK